MYGQGNYPPQFGQGTHPPIPPFQQRPPALPPPPPPPSFQQGPSAPQPSIFQHGNPFIPPHAGPPVPVPASGTMNASHSYLPPAPPLPPPSVHGSTSLAHSYPTAPQSSQWAQKVHHISPPVPPPLGQPSTGPCRPEMFFPLPLHRLQPPLPSQGTRPPPPQPPPPPPPTSSFFTPAFGSFVHMTHPESRFPFMVPPLPPPPPPPPPPPSSPPPPPPSPPSPPPTASPPPSGNLTSSPTPSMSDFPFGLDYLPSSNERSVFEDPASDSVDEVLRTHKFRNDAPARDAYTNPEDGTSCVASPPAEDGLSSVLNAKLDLPPPPPPPPPPSPSPPKPAEEKVLRNIEVLCQFIAKNGPSFEDMARQKEFGNPEFGFLFGGEQGSEAAVSHEYFVWMKKKCSLAYKSRGKHEQGDSPVRPSEVDSSVQPGSLMDAGVSHSPSDSDMDMEDDITQPEEQRVHNSLEGPNHETILPPNVLDMKEHLNSVQNASEHSQGKGATSENLPCYGSSPLAEQGKDSSPFRLLQDYASDDSSGNDDEPCLEDVSLVTGSPSGNGVATNLRGDIVSNSQPEIATKSLSTSETGFGTFSESALECAPSMPCKALECSLESERISKETGISSIVTGKIDEPVEDNPINKESINSDTSKKEDVKDASNEVKVDEFGRLVRQGASDSDSGDSRYKGKRANRGRSQSRSRSPHDRRRRRRKEKRSRSRSWSPKKQSSRSKSPSFRREFGGDKMRRDKGQLPDCLNFLRGRCHRGASCHFLHHGFDKSDEISRRHRSKNSRSSDFQEEVENVPFKKSVPRDENKSQDMQFFQDPGIISDCDSKLVVPNVAQTQSSGLLTNQVQETQDVEEQLLEPTDHLPDIGNQTVDTTTDCPVTDADVPKPPGDTSHGIPLSSLFDPTLQNTDHQPWQMLGSSASLSSPVPASETFQNQLPITEFHPHNISSVPSFVGHPFPSQSVHPSELIPPILPPMSFPQHFPPHSASVESIPPYQVSVANQHSRFSAPPNSSWTSLPPGPPQTSYINNSSLQPQQNPLPPRNDSSSRTFVGPYPTELPSYSQAEFQHLNHHPPMRETHQPPRHIENFRSNTLPMGNPPFGVPSLVGEDRFSRRPFQGLINSTTSRYTSDLLEGSRISHHYNPYASTFDQPLSSKFSSNVFRQETDTPYSTKYDTPYASSHVSVDGQGIGSLGSRPGGDQYDPLFDSIEPSLNSSRDRVTKLEPNKDSDPRLRLSGFYKPLDVEENKQSVEVENDEYGETADAEVGAVENESPDNSLDVANAPTGEIEIDKSKKSKKSKGSRSMKLFKVALADFVKEVLKPSWRQGNMSKEAFKTIVKKTVDKVSGAMKSHQIPKSQAKINQYIDSSQRKLTKLVMGYVDKFVKM